MQPSFRRRPFAAALVAAFAAPVYAADPAPPAAPSSSSTAAPQEMPAVKVEGRQENDYAPPAAVASPKYVAPILDTPQNITVISKEVIADQNVQTLRDILSNVPGITFGAGEGGGGYGDSITLRGYAGSNDITQDGIRDSAQVTRSDPFNMEQVEIFLGSNSVYAGAGAVGGTINIVSKTPINENVTGIQVGGGTDEYGRLTIDANRKLGEGIAGRANLMVHHNDVPGRDVEEFERWGIAPSITLGLGSPTTLTLSYFHQEDDNVPQYGVPFRNNRKVPGVNNEDYFGYSNFDTQEIENDMFTAILSHKFNDTVSARNLSRYGRATQLAIVDAPQGAVCLAEGPPLTPPTQFPAYPDCTADQVGTLRPSGGPRGNWRDTENEILANQTDLTWSFQTFGVKHTLLTGVQFTHENYHLDNFNLFRDASGAPLLLPLMDLENPDHTYDGEFNKTRIAKVEGEMDNAAVYVFESLELNPQWIASGGVRYERNEGFSAPAGIKLYTPPTAAVPEPDNSGIGGPGPATPPAHNDDDLLSYRAGLVFKPVKAGSVYVAYANSKTPSRATVNGSCTLSGVANANCDLDPEKAENYEVGVKWELLDAQLVLTGAVFRNERTNFRVNGDPATDGGAQTLDGKSRVDGVELTANGMVTKSWLVSTSYAYLDSEVLQSVSDETKAGIGDINKGDWLPNTPQHAFNLWTTYLLPMGFEVGGGARYQGKYLPNNSALAPFNDKIDDYWLYRAMVGYTMSPALSFQLNVQNLTDETYYTRVRGTGWAVPGDARSATLTATYLF